MPANLPPPSPPPSPSVDILKEYNDLLDKSIRLAKELGNVKLANELILKQQSSNIGEANKNLETQKRTLNSLQKEYRDITRTTVSLVEDWQSILKSINETTAEIAKTNSSFNKLEGIARNLKYHIEGTYNMSSGDLKISIAKSKAEKINLELAEKMLLKKEKLGTLNNDERQALNDIQNSIKINNSLYDQTLNHLKEQYRQQKNIENATGLTGKLLQSSRGLLETMGMEDLADVFEEANIAAEATANKLTEGGNKAATLIIKVRSIASAFKVVGKAITEYLSDPLVLAFGAFKLAKGIIGGVVGFIKKSFDFLVNKATESISAFKEIASVVSSEIQGIARSANLGATAAAKIYSRVVGMGPTAAASAQSFTQIQTALGNMDDLGDATYNHMVKLNIYAGYSAESFAGMQKYAKLLGKDTKEISENIMDTALAEIRSQKVAITQKEVYEDVAKLSNNIKLTLGGSEKSITKAVVTSKKLGLALEDALSAAKGFLNIEESISNEQELSLLTGKEVNLNQLRYYAATRDVEGVQSELTKLVNEHGQSILRNQFAMDAFTKASNLSEEAITNMIAGTKQNISATDQLNKAKKKGSDIDNQQATFSESEEMRQRGLTSMRAKGGAIFFEVLKRIENITAKINGMFAEVFGKHFAAWWNDSNVQKGLNTLEENVTRIFGLLLKDGGALDTIFKTIFSTNNTSGPLNYLNTVLAKGGPVEKNIEALNDILKGKKPDENTFLGGLYKTFMNIKGFFDKYGKIIAGGIAVNIGLKELTGKGLGDVFSGIYNKFFGKGSKSDPMYVKFADGSLDLVDKAKDTVTKEADKAKDTIKPRARDAKGRFTSTKDTTLTDKAKDTIKGTDLSKKEIVSKGKNLKNTIRDVGKGIGDAIKGFFKGIENALTSLGEGLKSVITNVFKGIENAFTSLGKGIGAAISNISNGIGKSLESLGKGLEKGIKSIAKGLGSFIESIGKGLGTAIGSIGKGLGTAIGAILKGVATGLKAFADPRILLGAGILAGSITLIGAGIAGATWIMGKALPSLAEGLEAFDNVNGDNLKNVGIGLAAFGAGLSLMGTGSILAAFGGLIDGIATFFGGGIENTFRKIENFGKYNFDKEKIKNNAEAIAYWAKGMALIGGGSALAGIGSLIGGLADGIASFFGRGIKDNLKKIENFGKYNFDKEKIKNNAEAIGYWAKGITLSSTKLSNLSVLENIDFNKIKNKIETFIKTTVPKNTGLTEFIKQINEFAQLENAINKLVKGVEKIGNAFSNFKKSVGSISAFPTDFSLPVNITKSVKLQTSKADDLISLGSLDKNKKEKGYGKRVLFDYSEGKRYDINNKDNIVFGTDPSLLKLIKNNSNIFSTKKTQTAPKGSIKVDDGFSLGETFNVNFNTLSKVISNITSTKDVIALLKEIINPQIMVNNLTKALDKIPISWLKIFQQINKLFNLNTLLSNENLSSKEKANQSILIGAKNIGTTLGTTLGASLMGSVTGGLGSFAGGSIGGYLGEILGEYIGESKPIRDTLSPPVAEVIDRNYKSKPVANDFIWRPGQGIERFSEQDTLMGVKEKSSNASTPNNTEVIALLKELINVSKSPQGNNKSQPTNITITLDGKTIASTSLDIYGGNAYKINS